MAVTAERFAEIMREEGYGEEVIDYLWNAGIEVGGDYVRSSLLSGERIRKLAQGATVSQRKALMKMAKGWRKRHSEI